MRAQIFSFISVLFLALSVVAQDKQLVTISGLAPAYVGGKLEINQIEDYMSMTESAIASTTVNPDSTFSVSFYITETQKIVVRANKNRAFMYIQPNAEYSVYFPEKDSYEPNRPNGNTVELSFFGMDSTDINYKILTYLRWQDDFIGNNFYLKSLKPMEFSKNLDIFKGNVEKYYGADTSDVYFKTYVRFSIASMDNIQHAAERNRYEKHDFYLKNFPVSYKNDAYMLYINSFYDRMMPRLPMETNNRVYLGILKSSPTLVMRALSTEYTLVNMRIREIVMIKTLSESYYSSDMPKTNILTILDSVANNSLFESNGIIAKNMLARLTELVPGGKSPEFALKNEHGEMKTLKAYAGKHLYIQFMDPSGLKSQLEIDPLIQLHEKYQDDVVFISICAKRDAAQSKAALDKIPWEKFTIEEGDAVFKNFKVATYPYYVLIDEMGYVVAAPALTPLPNGKYETIDKVFYYIQEARKALRENRR